MMATAFVDFKTESWSLLPKSKLLFGKLSDFDVVKYSGDLDKYITVLKNQQFVKLTAKQIKLTRNLNSWNVFSSLFNDSSTGIFAKKHKKSRIQILDSKIKQITSVIGAHKLWNLGYSGNGIKVAIFDTGLPDKHPHFKNIYEITNWTNEKTMYDTVGHGTFVAGLIGSLHKDCLGFAPNAELHIYRVFTNKQVSYTSWFLDAFNYALMKRINILNLSIGGPDFMDQPFVEKVLELSANNIIMVSAIGNDGPHYGTLNNPADQMDVIGIGGISYDDKLAKFSSRGMTTWEIPNGYGRLKPDIVTYGAGVFASSLSGGCRQLSGTSVASPVVTGAVVLLISSLPDASRHILNPAMVKQVLIEGADRLHSFNMFEQGAGKLNLFRSYQILKQFQHHVSVYPNYVDFSDCPYFWPYCTQPLYYSSQPVFLNFTIINSLALTSYIFQQPTWHSHLDAINGNLLQLNFTYSNKLWPWSGYLSVAMTVGWEGVDFEGEISGDIKFIVYSEVDTTKADNFYDNIVYVDAARRKLYESRIVIPMRVKVIPQPVRSQRILFDIGHNLRYPPAYFPRDNLKEKSDPLDWNGDHPHTNFKDMYEVLRAAGYFVEILGQPLTCFNAKNYGSFLLVDSEDYFWPEEIQKLQNDVNFWNLNLLLFSDWHNESVMSKIRFYDENTKKWWNPETGGANLPAINLLLRNWNISFGARVFEGEFTIGNQEMYYASGSSLVQFPVMEGSAFLKRDLKDQGQEILTGKTVVVKDVPILGLVDFNHKKGSNKSGAGGRIAVYGDSNCLDSAHMQKNCFGLLLSLLDWANSGRWPAFMHNEYSHSDDDLMQFNEKLLNSLLPKQTAEAVVGNSFAQHSRVVSSFSSTTDANNDVLYRPMAKCRELQWVKSSPIGGGSNQSELLPFLQRAQRLLLFDSNDDDSVGIGTAPFDAEIWAKRTGDSSNGSIDWQLFVPVLLVSALVFFTFRRLLSYFCRRFFRRLNGLLNSIF